MNTDTAWTVLHEHDVPMNAVEMALLAIIRSLETRITNLEASRARSAYREVAR